MKESAEKLFEASMAHITLLHRGSDMTSEKTSRLLREYVQTADILPAIPNDHISVESKLELYKILVNALNKWGAEDTSDNRRIAERGRTMALQFGFTQRAEEFNQMLRIIP